MKQRIGDRYEFDRTTDVIGKGGMGTVYKGIDTHTGATVAIKQLKPDIIEENPDFVERFEREAEALRRLNHPNIVTVITTIADDNAHYLVMEYVGGGSLWDEMQNHRPMPITRVLQIALDLSDALTRAHRQKIIHRDLKPANVLIAEDGTPRLTDFGVAQLRDKTRVTRTGAVVGTLNYLPPEALNGDPVDERADIWAFGVLLYELLSGINPFGDDNTTALITAILTKEPTDLLSLRPDTPPRLARLIGQMLAKDPDKRIDSIRKVGSELEDVIRNVDSGDDLSTQIKRELMQHATGRFDTPTPNQTQVKPITSKPLVTVVKSETGEEYVMMPKKYANKLRLTLVIVPILLVAIGVFIITRPKPTENETNITIIRDDDLLDERMPISIPIIPQETIGEGEYPVAILLNPDARNNHLQQNAFIEGLRRILQTDIPYSNIRVISESRMTLIAENIGTPLPARSDNIQLNNNAALLIRTQEQNDGLHVFIHLGDLTRFPHNAFERTVLERLINVELVTSSPEDIAPYIVGALAILHSADGDLFEFMRTMTILSQLTPSKVTPLTGGVSASVYGFFANFINDQQAALVAINAALNRDGGNPLLFMYRGLVRLRQLEFESASRDVITAQRIAPNNWILPAYAVANFNVTDIPTLDYLISLRPDDWFLHYLKADYLYSQNDLTSTRHALDVALTLNPETNVVHLLAFLVAMRQGRLQDASQILRDAVRLFPDPNLSYRLSNATFGELSVNTLIYTSLSNLIIGQYDTVIDSTNTFLSFVGNAQAFIRDQSQLPFTPTPNTDIDPRLSLVQASTTDVIPYLFAGDLFLIRGIAFCSIGNYPEALNAYSIGLAINPENHMLRLLRSEIYFLLGDQDKASADIALAMGLSDEMDNFITWATAVDNGNTGNGCADFFDVFMAMAG
jgi:serine/threonine protein kinase/tetratricopeptide (TPR) repeat protein